MSQPSSLPPLHPTPPLARLHVWQIQAVRDLLVFGAIIALIWVGYAMRAVTVPLLVALLLAYLFEPLVARGTQRLRASRPVVVAGLLLTIGLAAIVLLLILVPLIVGQSIQLIENIRSGQIQESMLQLKQYVPLDLQDDFERAILTITPRHLVAGVAATQGSLEAAPPTAATFSDQLDEERLRELIREELAAQDRAGSARSSPTAWWDLVKASGRAVFTFLGALVQLGLLAFLIPFYFFFFSVSYPGVVRFGRSLIPDSSRSRALELIGKMDRAVAGFVRGRIVICAIMGAMLAVSWMVCGVPYSIVLGFLVGAFNIVPYLGAIGIPLAVGLLAFDQLHQPEAQRMSWWAIVLLPTVVYLVVNSIEAYVLTPLIAGKATNLDPVTILVAVLAGGSVWGVYGMILAIPVAACLKILFTDVLLPKVRAWTHGQAEDPLPLSHR